VVEPVGSCDSDADAPVARRVQRHGAGPVQHDRAGDRPLVVHVAVLRELARPVRVQGILPSRVVVAGIRVDRATTPSRAGPAE